MNNFLRAFSNTFVERVKSPFFGPFIVSWSLFNWKVIYVTIFISNDTLFPLNKLDFIIDELNIYSGLYFPFLFSFFYIFIMPIVDRGLLKYTEEQKNKNLDLKLQIAKKHTVDGEKYFTLKDEFNKQKRIMLDFENEKNQTEIELQNKIVEISDLNIKIQQNEKMLTQLQKLRARDDLRPIFYGRWQSYVDGIQTDDLVVNESKYFVVGKDTKQVHKFDLGGVDYDDDNKRLIFIKFEPKNQQPLYYNDLKIIDKDTLEGKENFKTNIRYERRKI